MNPAVFLDLNGTLVEPVQVTSPDQYELINGSAEAIALLNAAGFLCPVITVQGRIGRGMYSEADFLDWFEGFREDLEQSGAQLLGPYVCPHRARTDCACAKPGPFLYRKAEADFQIDCGLSYVVGDTIGDIRAAQVIGARGCFVETGWSAKDLAEYRHEAVFVGADVLAVAEWIVRDRIGESNDR